MKSIKTIFNEVYSEGLAEYGFKKVPGKYPYFARMVGDEIIQVITYRTVSNGGPEFRQFVLLAGVITVYRESFKFDVAPDYMTSQYGELMNLTEVFDFSERYMSYCTRNESNMKKVIDQSLYNCKKHIIPVMNEIKSLKDCIEYYINYNFYGQTYIHDYFSEDFIKYGMDNSEGMLFYKCCNEEECKDLLYKYYEKYVDDNDKWINSAKTENVKAARIEMIERFKEAYNKNMLLAEQIYHNKNKLDYIQNVLEERRQRNTEELRRYKLL